MWRGDNLKQTLGESTRSFGEKLQRVATEMSPSPDEQEMIFKFRTGMIATIRKRLTLGKYATLEEWIEVAELAEKDLLLESKGTTELTSGLLKDEQSGKHLINYHEGLQQEAAPLAGVLALGVSETGISEKSKDNSKENEIKALKQKINLLEADAERRTSEQIPREQAFPFKGKTQFPKGNNSNNSNNFKNQNDRNLQHSNNQSKSGQTFKRFRNEREIAANKERRTNPRNGKYCDGCRRGNHNLDECW